MDFLNKGVIILHEKEKVKKNNSTDNFCGKTNILLGIRLQKFYNAST